MWVRDRGRVSCAVVMCRCHVPLSSQQACAEDGVTPSDTRKHRQYKQGLTRVCWMINPTWQHTTCHHFPLCTGFWHFVELSSQHALKSTPPLNCAPSAMQVCLFGPWRTALY
jgi:hypothetical protein